MSFLKQSYISFANPKPHEAKQFSKILSKSLDPSAGSVAYNPASVVIWDHGATFRRCYIEICFPSRVLQLSEGIMTTALK
jgi:hypothetical protein